ncbi:MAG: dihydroorotate dehydrogenase (quinone) [Elusimicrobia bacterium]|nr:MAG: dihydroorotate dehydrogenase (quinone) [Elusimicrobiota bacterium]
MTLYEQTLKPLLFSLDAETAHEWGTRALALANSFPPARFLVQALYADNTPEMKTTVAGLRFPNPVGLAAGFDKDCRLAGILPALGFGFIELGTITLDAQPGNPRPRIFRVPETEALINRLGFNNAGAEAARNHLRSLRSRPVPIGINIGLNKDAPQREAPERYAKTFMHLYTHGDYFVVNVSSPNTEGLRRLQEKHKLERILLALQEKNGDRKPIFVKLAPDLPVDALEELLPMLEENAAGVICANTTNSPERKADMLEEAQRLRGRPVHPPFQGGGVSGRPVEDPSTAMIREVYRLTGGRLPIIGVGGIFDAAGAYRKIRAGASLVQLYTGFIYRGPSLPSSIVRGLAALLKSHDLSSISEAVGLSHGPQLDPNRTPS